MEQSNTPHLVEPDEVARYFNVTIATVSRWVRGGVIPCIRPTRKIVRFDLAEVRRAVAKQKAGVK